LTADGQNLLLQILEPSLQLGPHRQQRAVTSVGCPSTSARTRASKVRGVVGPTFSPKPRSTPRTLISTSCRLVCKSFLAVSSARVSCAANDLQCTGLNQPRRINWAIPRASFLSVFTGMVLKAVRTCRVSSSSAGRPSASRPANSHCERGPASRPIRARVKGCARSQPIRASGSLATLASATILPVPSTMQTLDCSSDTSIPA
jgi:hypothetical protein